MKLHVLLAGLLGILTVGSTVFAQSAPSQPDSFDMIASATVRGFEIPQKGRLYLPPVGPAPSVRVRGRTALV